MLNHIDNLHQFYGEISGVRIARKHIGWYIKYSASGRPEADLFRNRINQIDDAETQLIMIAEYFSSQPNRIAA